MANIKPLDRTVKKWIRQSESSEPEYRAGVENPSGDWAEKTAAAEQNYEAGVRAAISRKGFSKGVVAAGTAKWKRNTLEKGPSRWTQGIALGMDAYRKGFQPYHDKIASLVLPARGPKGDPKNIQRVTAVTTALHDLKKQLQGG